MFPNKKILELVGSRVQVEMKGERNTLEGVLASADDYLNLHLTDTTEIVNGQKSRMLGSVILRGNNIILINPVG
jgi:small nuclear ribonucleoprotein (snRNP)-like protein